MFAKAHGGGQGLTAVAALLGSILAGCGDGRECLTRDDCPQGQICVMGECRPEATKDAGSDGGGQDSGLPDAGSPDGSLPDGGHPDAGGCQYVDDGVINRQELVIEVGLGATYRVNQTSPVAVDLVGQMSGGEPLWDFTSSTSPDRSVVDELLPVAGTWFASDFPDATYSALIDESTGTLGVYRVTPDAVSMLGIVSQEENKTILTYDPPVDLMRFPIELGDSYIVETTSSGYYNWTMTTLEETYELTVDARGRVVVPAGSFHALRLRTDFTQHIPYTMIWVERIIYVWVTECFGVVARVRSEDDETEPLFTSAAELRRMTL
ncbi:MAG: hypothetical protein RBU30_15710 [Polyangia bacterium]|nr:hypothetical protein [Polyangia bacterium]